VTMQAQVSVSVHVMGNPGCLYKIETNFDNL
jgi:hypothetical protein